MTQLIPSAHIETEKGYRISQSEYKRLRLVLPWAGFSFVKQSLITDFVVPTNGETTRRMRIERIRRSADGSDGVRCVHCVKKHPVKGDAGKHVRAETESIVGADEALSFILAEIGALGAPLPYYSKKRWNFQGSYRGFEMTVSLDHAYGLGRFSGHYLEIEAILPLLSEQDVLTQALSAISELSENLLTDARPTKISYRKMLMQSWIRQHNSNKKAKGHQKLQKAKAKYRKILKKVVA
jgi:adenylate cyclase class IV